METSGAPNPSLNVEQELLRRFPSTKDDPPYGGPPFDELWVSRDPTGRAGDVLLEFALKEEGNDERVDAERLDQSQTNDHRRLDFASCARVAGDALECTESC